MPESFTTFDSFIQWWIRGHIAPAEAILDVGPGMGKYGRMLRGSYPNVDAVEIFEPYIGMFGLSGLYRKVMVGDIRSFDVSDYDLVIMGDVLEHLSVDEACGVLSRCRQTIVQVPYLYRQGIIYDNPAEQHQQEDLTPEVMRERYPELRELIISRGHAGVYLKTFTPMAKEMAEDGRLEKLGGMAT